jgi:hypothetical protein
MTKYPHGIIDGTWHGSLMTANDGDQFMWWSHEKSKVVEGGNIKGLNIMTGFTNSQKLSWMNNIILALEISGSVFSQKFKATGYEWKYGIVCCSGLGMRINSSFCLSVECLDPLVFLFSVHFRYCCSCFSVCTPDFRHNTNRTQPDLGIILFQLLSE